MECTLVQIYVSIVIRSYYSPTFYQSVIKTHYVIMFIKVQSVEVSNVSHTMRKDHSRICMKLFTV